MDERNFGERINTSDSVEQTERGTDSSIVDLDSSLVYKGSVLARLIQQTTMSTGVVDVDVMEEKLVHEDSLYKKIASNILEMGAIVEEAVVSPNTGSIAALLNHEESEYFLARWNEIEDKFVSEPRSAVQQADTLVCEMIDKIIEIFANEHGYLEGQWQEDSNVSTEDLRQALQHYRSLFNRLAT